MTKKLEMLNKEKEKTRVIEQKIVDRAQKEEREE
jgi:hypothetical protein